MHYTISTVSPFVAYTKLLLVLPVFCSAICLMFTIFNIMRCRDAAERRLRTYIAAYLLVSGVFWFMLLDSTAFGDNYSTAILRVLFSFYVWGLPLTLLIRRYVSLVRNFGTNTPKTYRSDMGFDPEIECRWYLSKLISAASLLLVLGVTLGLTSHSALWFCVNTISMIGWQVMLVYHLIERQSRLDIKTARKAKSIAGAASDDNTGLTRKALDDYFRSQKPYIDPRFMLADLAEAMDINRSEMSGFINKTYGMNFKRLVNRWRLSEFERLMSLPANERKNPYKIQQLAGFTDSRHYLRALQAENEAENKTENRSEAENVTGQGTEDENRNETENKTEEL